MTQESHDTDQTQPPKPKEQQSFWSKELKSSKERLRKYHKDGDLVVQRYLDARLRGNSERTSQERSNLFRLNFFHNNVNTVQSMLYGRVPKIDVKRSFADANDDPARVAGILLKRMLQSSVEDPGESTEDVLRSCLQDRLLPGMGTARVRYEFTAVDTVVTVQNIDGTTQQVQQKEVVSEDAPLDYVHWRDVLWGFGRKWSDVQWVSFRTYPKKDEAEKRWGKDKAEQLEYKHRNISTDESTGENDPDMKDPWATAEVYEIWDKKARKVHWCAIEADKILETREDTLKLDGFYPCPEPLMANVTTSMYIPVADFKMAQDLYNEIDTLQTRISIITRAVKVVGVYDAGTPEIQRMLKEGTDNDLIPVEKWAMFAEKEGLQGQIDWYPVADVVAALSKLQEMLATTIQLLYQVTGLSDILRGTLDNQYEGVGQTQDKAKFASVRIQSLQEQFAKFASEAMQLRAEVISKHFEERTILVQSNAQFLQEDPQLIQAGVQLLKDPQAAPYRVEIKPESIAMIDYAMLQQERTMYLNGLSTFIQSGGALVKEVPQAGGVLMELLKWGLAGFKGSETIEGVLDKAIQQVQNAPPKQEGEPAPPSPMEEAQADIMVARQKANFDMEEEQQKSDLKMRELEAEHISEMQQILATAESGNLREQLQAYYGMLENRAKTHDELTKIKAMPKSTSNG